MKQKIVIKVEMNDDKCRSRAMKISVEAAGVEKAALKGSGKDQVEVEGHGIDSVELTRRLRRNVGCAELVSVSEVKKEDEKNKDEIIYLPPGAFVMAPHCYGFPDAYCRCEEREPACIIM